jgi:MoaA/NifB/PqqE/SkfB family radical SAM enzyme
MNKTYCPLPFSHLAIRPNGDVYPCCAFRWDSVPADFKISDPNIFNHPFLEDIRTKMKNNEVVDGCSKCYENEEKTGKSTRLYFLEKGQDFGLNIANTDPSLVYLDLALSNTCNNKCRMCGPELSTSWYNDAKLLNRKIPKGILEQKTVLENYDLSQLRFIKLIGGEPLMEQAKFIDVLQRCDRSQLSILLTTNVTLIPNDELLSLIKECKEVWINLSIDASGNLNDFLRKGSKWEKTVEVAKWFYDNFPEGFVNVNGAVSIYNINHIDKLYLFVKSNMPKAHLSYVVVDGPEWMHPKHLPEIVKDSIKQKIEIWKQITNLSFFNVLESELYKTGDFKLFMKGDKELSNIRNEHWKDYNPELYEMVKTYYE